VALELPALGIADRNSVAGTVRAWEAAKATGVRLVAGCRLDLADGTSLLVYPADLVAADPAALDRQGAGTNAYDVWGVPNFVTVTMVGRFGYTGQAWLPELAGGPVQCRRPCQPDQPADLHKKTGNILRAEASQ
jgi:hypothetical protein